MHRSSIRPLFFSLFFLSLITLAPRAFGQQAASKATGKIHTDRTAKETRSLPLPDAANESFTFAVFGDRTGGPAEGIKVLAQGVEDVNLLDPDLVMTVGDLINGYNRAPEWMKQMAEFHQTMDKLDMPWFPVAGNHDVYWRGPPGERPPGEHEARYEKHFGPFWYWFEHKNCGFLVLYTDEGVPGDTRARSFRDPEQHQFSPAQKAFLKKSLADMKDLQHVFVFLHHPRWRSQYAGSDWDTVHPLLAANGNVRAVFAGHIHKMTYGGNRDGIEYYSLATTGGGLPASMISPVTGFLHHFNVVTVRSNGFTMAAVPVGEVIDPKTFTAEYDTGIRALRDLAPSFRDDFVVQQDGSAKGRLSVELKNPCPNPLEVHLVPAFGRGTAATPDHTTTTIKPGETRRFEFGYKRDAGELDRMELPRLQFRFDALFEGSRLSFPERALPVPARLEGATASAVDQPNSSTHLKLRGRPDCLRVANESFVLPDGPVTLEARVRPSTAKQSAVVLAKTEASEYNLELKNGRPQFIIHLDGAYVSVSGPDPLPAKEWTHLAGVFDGSEVRLYQNGKRVGANPGKGARTKNRLPFYIGADTDGRGAASRWFAGGIDEVRLSKSARYTDDFEPEDRHKSDDNTVLLFHLDRAIGPFVPGANEIHATRLGRAKFGE